MHETLKGRAMRFGENTNSSSAETGLQVGVHLGRPWSQQRGKRWRAHRMYWYHFDQVGALTGFRQLGGVVFWICPSVACAGANHIAGRRGRQKWGRANARGPGLVAPGRNPPALVVPAGGPATFLSATPGWPFSRAGRDWANELHWCPPNSLAPPLFPSHPVGASTAAEQNFSESFAREGRKASLECRGSAQKHVRSRALVYFFAVTLETHFWPAWPRA